MDKPFKGLECSFEQVYFLHVFGRYRQVPEGQMQALEGHEQTLKEVRMFIKENKYVASFEKCNKVWRAVVSVMCPGWT